MDAISIATMNRVASAIPATIPPVRGMFESHPIPQHMVGWRHVKTGESVFFAHELTGKVTDPFGVIHDAVVADDIWKRAIEVQRALDFVADYFVPQRAGEFPTSSAQDLLPILRRYPHPQGLNLRGLNHILTARGSEEVKNILLAK